MKKLLSVIVVLLLALVLVGCGNEDNVNSWSDLDNSYYWQSSSLSYIEYYNLKDSLIVCIIVNEPIWDTYYSNYGGAYEYEFYGGYIDYIYVWENGLLDVTFTSGEQTIIKDYVAIHFDT